MDAETQTIEAAGVDTADLIEKLEAAREEGDEQRVQKLEAILNGNQVEATEAEGSVASEPTEAGQASA